ncbi:uncharacterized protein LOC112512529 isoform X3 [Cynara cardunculus var. scolymus]|uniref:uncharacterized protein LOC112512529 isoform X3 n=1 Tax=Cynara cardunculus var. scolymus TaxID=59895 RepID=UPI000D622FFE|nr:uncharacterized protein LOC112512529 isoform X3 [Cynara cardunculus var. scolymus]
MMFLVFLILVHARGNFSSCVPMFVLSNVPCNILLLVCTRFSATSLTCFFFNFRFASQGIRRNNLTTHCGKGKVGTIMKTEDAENAKDAGAKFVMSPAIVEGILDQDNDDFLYIPGVMTPSEILSSYNAGAKIVKVYPVSAVGGVGYIATLKKPFPHIPMVASQGITTDSVGEYIAKGASSVVLSDAIFDKEAMAQRNFSAVYRLAQFAASQGNEAVERKRKIYAS